MLKIYNSSKRTKLEFSCSSERIVKIYACGVTVYDFCHIGHARTSIVVDIIVRFLRYIGYKVLYVRNITDVDDKILIKANELGCSTYALTSKMISYMKDDFKKLMLLNPDYEPKATEYISQMKEMISILLKKKFAYISNSGDVYFDVSKFDDYGKLSKQPLENLTRTRTNNINNKINPHDFVLWKLVESNEYKYNIYWESPWGLGRPGWHIECSAMAKSLLGNTVDIHVGGSDLKFPHHENENAQSSCANGEIFVKYWMHIGMVLSNSEKMSKSLNNFITIKEVLENFNPEIIKTFFLLTHYRKPIDFSFENLKLAQKKLERFYMALSLSKETKIFNNTDFKTPFLNKFLEAMYDDFNTPKVFNVLDDLTKEIFSLEKKGDDIKTTLFVNELKSLGNIIGLFYEDPNEFLKGSKNFNDNEIDKKIDIINQARKDKNWELADKLKKELLLSGIQVEDKLTGSTWRWIN